MVCWIITVAALLSGTAAADPGAVSIGFSFILLVVLSYWKQTKM